MGRILRKNRVGKEDSENILLALKTPEYSSKIRPKRSALVDKTNALKTKEVVNQKMSANAPKLKERKKRLRTPKEEEKKEGNITRRRRSTKENEKKLGKTSGDATSNPLGDKTNALLSTKELIRVDDIETVKEDILSKDDKPASEEDLVDVNNENIPKSVSLESSITKRPARNASKFGNGWVAALQKSRTSKERDTESKEACTQESKSAVTKIHKPGAPEQNKRARLDAKAITTDDESEEILTSQKKLSGDKLGKSQDAKQQQPDRFPSESDEGSPPKSPRRKMPRRNAAKFEKGWISTLGRRRSSKEPDAESIKALPKNKKSPVDDQTESVEGHRTGKDIDKILDSESRSNTKVTSEAIDEKRKARGRPLVSRKKRVETTHDAIKEKDLESPKKPEDVSAKSRGLKNFESRIAAKLGVDMSCQIAETKEIPKKPAGETCPRKLRKRGADKKVKTYAEVEENEDEVLEDLNSNTDDGKTAVKPSTSSRKAKMEQIKATSKSNEVPSTIAKPKGHKLGLVKNDAISSISNVISSSLREPKPGCSRDPDLTTPLRRSGSTKMANSNKSPVVAPTPSLFSLFKKPDAPRRNSYENKIFVSGSKSSSPGEATAKKQPPVYGDPNMTPLKKTSALPLEKKEELYEFECDENEPKQKKKHKPIMKIQRVRAVKRKKPKVYEADPETEARVLKNLDLSPGMFEEFRSAKRKKVENSAGVVAAMPSKAAHPVKAVQFNNVHPSVTAVPVGLGLDNEPMSSPCRDYGHSTPMRSDAPSMFLEECKDKFGRISAKVYSPVKSKDSPMRINSPNVILDDSRNQFGRLTAKVCSPVHSKGSPIPILMAEYNNDPVRHGDSSRQSVVSNTSCVSAISGDSIYHDNIDVSASTPVKLKKNNSTYRSQRRKPLELNISNCFGFDEPEIIEEPLISPIKSTIHVPERTAPLQPAPILKSKPPVMRPPPQPLAVDVDQVIKQLRFEVGNDSSVNNSANISVYDDSEITMKNKSPIKKYFLPKDDPKHQPKNAQDSTLDDGNDSLSPIPAAPKVPRLSYERPNKLRKKKVIEPVYKEASECESAEDSEESDAEPETEPVEEIFKPTKNIYPAKKKEAPKKKEKGMTKKEESELEKWAEMFNSQCDQIDSFGLVVE